MKFSRKVWRHIPAGSYPLDVGFILRASGRWNRPGLYGCLYTSLTKNGALAEYRKYLRLSASTGLASSRELVSLHVDVQPVMDLTDPVSSPVNVSEPFLTGDDPKDVELCRKLADSLRNRDYCGVVAPSSAEKGRKNLIIYTDVGPAGNVSLSAGSDRIAI